MSFYFLEDICRNYDLILIDNSVLSYDIDKLFPLNPQKKFTKKDLKYFIYFYEQAEILAEILKTGGRIFTNVNSICLYEEYKRELEDKFKRKISPDSRNVYDLLSIALSNHKEIYRILDSFIIRLDTKTYTRINHRFENLESLLKSGIFLLYYAAIERYYRGAKVSIVTKDLNFKKCREIFGVDIPIFYSNPDEISYIFENI